MTQRIQPYFPAMTSAAPGGEAKVLTREQKIFDLAVRQQTPGADPVTLYSGRVEQVHNVIADISSILRFAAYMDPKIASHPALAIEGVTTGFSAFLGLKTAVVGAQGISKALEIEDYKGALENILSVATGSAQAVAGTDYLAARVASVASVLNPTNTTLASALNILYTVGDGLFGALYGIWAVWSGVKVVQGEMFRHKLQKQGDATEQLAYLQGRVNVTGQDAINHLAKTWKDADRATLIDQAGLKPEQLKELSQRARGDDEVLDALLKNAALLHALQEVGVKRLVTGCKGLKQPKVNLETFIRKTYAVKTLAWVGVAAETEKMQKRREAKLARLVGNACVKKIKEADLSQVKETAPLLMKEVLGEVSTKRNLNLIMGIAATLGVAAMIASAIFTAGLIPIIATGVLFIVSFLFLAVDGYALHQALKNSEPEAHDKKLLWISSAVCLALMAGAFAVTTVFSLGMVPLVIAGAIALGWLGVTLFAIKKGNVNVDALERFKKLLLSGDLDEKAIQKALTQFSPEGKAAVLKLINLDHMKALVGEEGLESYIEALLDPDHFAQFIAFEKRRENQELLAKEATRLQELQKLYDTVMSEAAAVVKTEAALGRVLLKD